MGIAQYDPAAMSRPAWNAGRKVDVKKPLKQRQIWAIRFYLYTERGCEIERCSISQSTAGYEAPPIRPLTRARDFQKLPLAKTYKRRW